MPKNTIYVGPADSGAGKPLNVEGVSLTASILPGSLVEQAATGLQINANAATLFGQQFLVADKDQMRTKLVTDAWLIAENMVALKGRSGEFFHVRVAAGQNITSRGVGLSSNGDGTFKIAVVPATVGATSEQVLCHSDEIINTGGSVALVLVTVQ